MFPTTQRKAFKKNKSGHTCKLDGAAWKDCTSAHYNVDEHCKPEYTAGYAVWL